jgi:HlyD family secretion protein
MMKTRWWRKWLWLVIPAGIAGYPFYQKKIAPIPVVAHTVVRGEVVGGVAGTGTLEARVTTTISARIQERLAEVLVDQGDKVTKGQMLALLDDVELKQQVEMAEAVLAAARQTGVRVGADLARSEAVLDQAKLEHERMTGLVASRAVSRSDLDKASEAMRVAEADLVRSKAAIAEAHGQVVVAEKTARYHKERLAFTEIRAPYDGLVIRRDRDAGEIVVPGASLMKVISLDEIWVRAWIDETVIGSLAVDQPARVMFRSHPSMIYQGRVKRMGRENDRETREFLVDVGTNSLPENWVIGQRAEVFIETSRQADALVVPQDFIGWTGGRQGVFVNEGGRAKWREIGTGASGAGLAAVTDGLKSGEQVLRAPSGVKPPISNGQRVKFQ